MIRVLIVEDQRMAREDMENYIQSSGRYCLAASITNAAMAETVCRQSRCELVLMDVCTENDESGLVAAEKIKKTMPQIKVIIVTSLVAEMLSKMLTMRKIEHNVLNAKLHQKEADIVAKAGLPVFFRPAACGAHF